ncbi:MAG: radical SAM protein [Candidatus Diapherotrites archaeon]|nr:radical SAM protein [Candidatus Diapherotrites archaeon]
MKVLLMTTNVRPQLKISEMPLITPPLNLMYVGEFLRQNGHEPKIVDAHGHNYLMDDVIRIAKKFEPGMICASVYSTDLRFCHSYLKQVRGALPGVKIAVGGIHSTNLPEQTLHEFEMIDFIIRGEGELTTKELADALEKNRPLSEVKGISYRDEHGHVRHNADQPTIMDLDSIPIPGRDLIDTRIYYSKVAKRNPIDTLITTRGCPFRCSFCPRLDNDFRKYRMRSPENVVEELKFIMEAGAKNIDFYDETFTLDKERVKKIFELADKEGLDFDFRARTRVNAVDRELLELFAQHNCDTIGYGIESGNQRVLDEIGKGITLEQVKTAVALTKKNNINVLGFFVVGLKGDTPESIQDTINFACKLNTEFATFNYAMPYPGSEDYLTAKANGTLQGDWGMDKPTPWIKLPWMNKHGDVIKWADKAYRTFYFRPRYVSNWAYRTVRQRNWNQLAYAARNAWKGVRNVNFQVLAESEE